MSMWYYGFLVEARRELADLPVVPSVREQLEALPAEEVLLRSSDPPVMESTDLLRAENTLSGLKPQELLRAETDRDPVKSL
jgi:hypothetical protein